VQPLFLGIFQLAMFDYQRMNLTTGTAKDLAIINSFPSEAKLPIGQKKDLMKSGLRLSACPDLVCSRATCNELPLSIYMLCIYM